MFQSARLKLTAWYLSIIMLISIIFSIVIYAVVTSQIEGLIRRQNDRIKRFQFNIVNAPPPFYEPPIISTDDLQKQKQQLLYALIFFDAGILVLAGAAGYFLAGRTLNPIKLMINEQNQFISDASHELRTPIATLRAEMEGSLLEKRISDMQARKLITSNLEELETLQNLSNGLLRLTQVHSVNGTRQKKDISILTVVESAHKKITTLAEKKNIRIRISVEDCVIKGDETSLVELFVILLDNAIKYSPRDSEIVIFSSNTPERLKITVKDNGIGISKKDLPHIFERFYRADKSRSLVDGYGLGLSIAKAIAENHFGTIHASSILGNGSAFTLQFPLSS